jgi:hypothetical protein
VSRAGPCVKDTEFRFLCSCDKCCRSAARSWTGLMDRVRDGDISLTEAQAIDEAKR